MKSNPLVIGNFFSGMGHSLYQAGKSPMPYLPTGSDESLRFPDRTTKL